MPEDERFLPIDDGIMLKLDELAVGDRVVLRFRLPEVELLEGGPSSSDALGEILLISEDFVRLRTRRGPFDVPRQRITHAKRVPPAPVRRQRTAR